MILGAFIAHPFLLDGSSMHVILALLRINESASCTVVEEEIVASFQRGLKRVRLRPVNKDATEHISF